jgi:hypothetical protein
LILREIIAMKNKWLKLAGDLLEKGSDLLSNKSCNDWDFPADWSEEEKIEFVQSMFQQNGNPQEFDSSNLNVPDWWVASFLSQQLINSAKMEPS